MAAPSSVAFPTALLESPRFGIIAADSDGRLQVRSKGAQRLFG